jgi:hypothetical protein
VTPSVFITGESRLPDDEYTRVDLNWFTEKAAGVNIRELKLPCD